MPHVDAEQPQDKPNRSLEPDVVELEAFMLTLFRYAGEDGYFSMRAFYHDNKLFRVWGAPLRKDTAARPIEIAARLIRLAANEPASVVFCPPTCVFNNSDGKSAKEEDFLKGLVLSAELDSHPNEALTKAEEILGQATVIVKSGGQWISDGIAEDKLHVYWRLKVPAGKEDFNKLKQVLAMLAFQVGADRSNATPVHCLRWPGSWHRKSAPRLCHIVECRPDVEIDLDEAHRRLKEAATKFRTFDGEAGDRKEKTSDDKARWYANILAGIEWHQSSLQLTNCLIFDYFGNAEKVVREVEDLFDQYKGPHDERWHSRRGNVRRLVYGGDGAGGCLAKWKEKHPEPAGIDWQRQCHRNDKGALSNNYHNAYIAASCAPELKNDIAFDEFAQQAVLRGEPIIDRHLGEIQSWMQDAGLRAISFDNVTRAVSNYARSRPFHPVKDYFERIRWDNNDRNSTWLVDYCGAEDTPANRMFGSLFLRSMVARILNPGCKADYMLVLEGDQGILKSMICDVLASPWFSDALPDITASAKDASMHLRGVWLCEIAELHAFNRAETTHLKSFISRRIERFRPPYGRMEVEEPRQVVFIGTTNKDAYLKDETGGRRFWPVKIGIVKIAELRRDRDQLIAQAVAEVKRGERHWPEQAFEREYIAPLQERRYDADDAWEEPLTEFLTGKTSTTFTDIMGALDFGNGSGGAFGSTPINRASKTDQNRIKSILTKLGWINTGERNSAGRKLWVKR